MAFTKRKLTPCLFSDSEFLDLYKLILKLMDKNMDDLRIFAVERLCEFWQQDEKLFLANLHGLKQSINYITDSGAISILFAFI